MDNIKYILAAESSKLQNFITHGLSRGRTKKENTEREQK